jgi:hypothetical protein
MGPDYRSPDINKICHEWDSVRGGGARVVWRAYTGVIHCVVDQIPNLQIALPPQNKYLGGEGDSDR